MLLIDCKAALAAEGEEDMATLFVGAILIGIIALIVRSMIRNKKKGKSLQCGCDCGNCGGHCH